MDNDDYYHQRFFRILYSDMVRRIEKYKSIEKIENHEARKQLEIQFLKEQSKTIKKFIEQENILGLN